MSEDRCIMTKPIRAMAGKWQDKSFRYSAGSIEYVLEKVYAEREYSESPVQFWPRLWKFGLVQG